MASSTSLNPINSAVRTALHAGLNIDGYNTLRDGCQNGVTYRTTVGEVDAQKIRAGGEPGGTLAGKRDGGTFDINFGDIDVANVSLYHALANTYGGYDYTDNTTWHNWDFNLQGATSPDPYMKLLFEPGSRYPVTLLNGVHQGYTINATPNGNYTFTSTMAVGQEHWWGDATQDVGSGSTTPTITGPYVEVYDETNTDDLRVLVVSNTSGVLVLRSRFGAGAFGTSGDVSYTLGSAPARLLDGATGLSISASNSSPIQFSAPSGGTFTANDEFSFPVRRRLSSAAKPPWVQSFPTARVIPTVNTQVYIDGAQTSIEGGWSATCQWETLENLADTSKEYGSTPEVTGDFEATVTLNRRLQSLVFQEALDRGSSIAVVLDGVSNTLIGATSVYYTFRHVFPAMRPIGESQGVDEGGQNRDEIVTLRAQVPSSSYSYDGGTYDSHVHCQIKGGVSAL